MATTTSSTAELGLDFIQRVMRDIKALQDGMIGVNESLAQIRLGIELERKTREGNVSTLHEQLSREISSEGQRRLELEQRLDGFESQCKNWVAALGKQSLAAKEHLASLDSTTTELTAQQESSSTRVSQLESSMALKCNAGDYERLLAKVSAMQVDVDRDRVATDSAFRTAATRAAQDSAAVKEQLDALQRMSEATKRSTMGELCALTTKSESMEAMLKTRARAADVQTIEQRLREAEKALENAAEELNRRAAAASLKAVSDRLTELTLDFQTSQGRAEATTESHLTRLNALDAGHSKLERQFEADRERSSACWVALEKELASRPDRAEADAVAGRLAAAEEATASLSQTVAAKAGADEVAQLCQRADKLEASLAAKADLPAFQEVSRSVTEQGSQQALLTSRSDEHQAVLAKLQEQARENGTTLAETAARSLELQTKVGQKLDVDDACTRDGMEAALLGFYRKEEVDAMLARVWWRVGDISKAARTTPLRAPLTAR